MNNKFKEILDHEEAILFFYEYFRNNEFSSKAVFMDFLQEKTLEKTEIINSLNNLIQKEIFDIIDDIDNHKELIPDILNFAENLFQYNLNDKSVYLDIYLSREIFVQMFNYFEKINDYNNQLICLYWLERISKSINDYDSGMCFAKKARRFLKIIDEISSDSLIVLIKILINKTNIFAISHEHKKNILYSKSVVKYIEVLYKKNKILKDKYDFWMYVLYNNIVDSCSFIIRSCKNISKDFIKQAYEYSKIAQYFELKLDGGVVSALTPLVLEISYYNGDFDRNEYYKKISEYLFILENSKQSDSFNDTKEEIEVSLRELYLIDILDNEELLPKRKVELMQEMFDIMFITFAKSRMTQEEMNFRKYIINYIQIASKVISKEDIIKNISIILRNLHPFTFGHSIEVSAISLVITEIIIDYNPNYFIGLFDYKTIKDVITNKANILNFVKYCGLSHDFGKIGIIAIISKSNRLTDYEFDSIKQHSMMGYEILAASEETKNFAYIALCHHKMNGLIEGYPPSVFEECYEFSSVINIINLADTVSAATDVYGRTYNGRKYLSDVQGEINRASDKYDPILLEIFNQDCCIEKIKHIITDSRDDLLYRIFSNKEVAI